jgi:hypothetical protein
MGQEGFQVILSSAQSGFEKTCHGICGLLTRGHFDRAEDKREKECAAQAR